MMKYIIIAIGFFAFSCNATKLIPKEKVIQSIKEVKYETWMEKLYETKNAAFERSSFYTITEYDKSNRVVLETEFAGGSKKRKTTSYVYNKKGDLLSEECIYVEPNYDTDNYLINYEYDYDKGNTLRSYLKKEYPDGARSWFIQRINLFQDTFLIESIVTDDTWDELQKHKSVYVYNNFGKLDSIKTYNEQQVLTGIEVYDYDENNILKSIFDYYLGHRIGDTYFEIFDDKGNIIESTYTAASGYHSSSVYKFNSEGHVVLDKNIHTDLTSQKIISTELFTTDYTYDEFGNWTKAVIQKDSTDHFTKLRIIEYH